jgi:hypothetical protein
MARGGAEKPETIAVLLAGQTGPAGVIFKTEEALGMRHQADDAASGITDAGNAAGAAVKVVFGVVAKGYLAGFFQGAQN